MGQTMIVWLVCSLSFIAPMTNRSKDDSPLEGRKGNAVNTSLRFLALGDSYNIGEAVNPADRWPEQVVRLMRTRGMEIEEPVLIARTGWTTDELMGAIAETKPQGSFDLVSLLIGVNNQYRERDIREYRKEFKELLDRALGF